MTLVDERSPLLFHVLNDSVHALNGQNQWCLTHHLLDSRTKPRPRIRRQRIAPYAWL
jgi:hypothetical protein